MHSRRIAALFLVVLALPLAAGEAKLDLQHWNAMLEEIAREKYPIDAIVLSRGSKIVAQYHRRGTTAETPHDLRSATKSITAILTGIAVDRQLIESLDVPVASLLGEFTPHKSWHKDEPITIRHLLTMRSGLACDDWQSASPGNEERMYRTKDWLQFFFSIPRQEEPGKTFRYCTAGVVALGEIVARAGGRRLSLLASDWLFEPLAIGEARWANAPRGVTDAGGHIQLTAASMLKIGMLIRDGGQWNGRRIVSQSWIDEMLTPRTAVYPTRPQAAQYGYLWWLQPVENGVVRSYQARGNGGQYIMVVPATQLVVAFTGRAYNNPRQFVPFDLMQRYLIPMANGAPSEP